MDSFDARVAADNLVDTDNLDTDNPDTDTDRLLGVWVVDRRQLEEHIDPHRFHLEHFRER